MRTLYSEITGKLYILERKHRTQQTACDTCILRGECYSRHSKTNSICPAKSGQNWIRVSSKAVDYFKEKR